MAFSSIFFSNFSIGFRWLVLLLTGFACTDLCSQSGGCAPDKYEVFVFDGGSSGSKTANGGAQTLTYTTSYNFQVFASQPVKQGDLITYTVDNVKGWWIFSGEAKEQVLPGLWETETWNTSVTYNSWTPAGGTVVFDLSKNKVTRIKFWKAQPVFPNTATFYGLDYIEATGFTVLQIDLPSGWGFSNNYQVKGQCVFQPIDTQPPVANCKNSALLLLDASGVAAVSPADLDFFSTDNCAIEKMWVEPAFFDCSALNNLQTARLFVEDAAGNQSVCEANFINVLDQLPPEVTCPDIEAELDANGMKILSADDFQLTGSDNCGTFSFHSTEPETLCCADFGLRLVYVWATDPSGNFGGCWSFVRVKSKVPELELTTENRFFPPVSLIKINPSTDVSDKFVKICADGSLRTSKVTLRGCHDLKKLKIRVKENPSGDNGGLFGRFEQEPSSKDDELVFWYEHPACWDDPNSNVNLTFKQLHFEVFEPVEDRVLITLPARIFRTPVLMVHGFWANGSESFGKMRDQFLKAPPASPPHWVSSLVKFADYKNTNAASFYQNRYVVLTHWRNFLYELTRVNHFSTGRVTVVGHSMGGLLTRVFIQSDAYYNDINRLITINTPHSGTQAADFLFGHYGPVRAFFDLIGKNTSQGAVEDLQATSLALWSPLDGLNLKNSLKKNLVPSHAILTHTLDVNTIHPIARVLLSVIGLESGGKPAHDFLTEDIFGNQWHDVIVPLNSQTGGLTAPHVSLIDDQWHSSTENPQVFARLHELLGKCPSDVGVFSPDGFHPEKLEYNYQLPNDSPTGNGKLKILWPPDASVFAAGEKIQVELEASGDINTIAMTVGNNDLNPALQIQSAAKATFDYTIPPDALGKVQIKGFGFGPNGAADHSQVDIFVQTNADAVALKAQHREVYVAVGGLASVAAKGVFSDSIERVLTHQPATVFWMADSSIARVAASGVVLGLHPDTTTMLHLAYQTFRDSVRVIVLPGQPLVSTRPEADAQPSKRVSIKLENFPNPVPATNGTTFWLTIAEPSAVFLEIFDLTGRTVFSQQKQNLSNGKNPILWGDNAANGSVLPNGIYFARAKTATGAVSNCLKLVVVRE